MLLVRTLCRRAAAGSNVPRTQVHVSSLRVSPPAPQRLLSSHLARIAALGIQECVSGHSIHFTHTHRRDAHKDSKAMPLPVTNTANERLCKALHHAEKYFASCRAQVRSSNDSSNVSSLMPVMVRVEADTTGVHPVRTLRDVAEDTLDKDQEDEVRTVHSSPHHENDGIALPCLDPTYAERSQARLHVLLQQWVSYAAMRVTPSDFTRYQSRIATLLIPRKQPSLLLSSQPHLMHSTPQDGGSSSSTSASELLWQALVRRGAKSYIELLQHHAAQPQSAAEWRHLCDILCCVKSERESIDSDAKIHVVTTSGQYNSIPLLPSGMSSVTSITNHASLGTESQVRSSLHPLSAWALLAEMTTAAECVALLRWSRLWAPTCALWTRDVAHVWQRCRFALTNEESVDCDASTQATLVQWWQEACRTEQSGQDGGSSTALSASSHHRNGSLSGAAAALQRYVSATCVHEKTDESAASSSSTSATTPDGVRYRNELVLRGAWRELLESVHQHALHLTMKGAKETHIISDTDVMSYVRARLPGLGALFNARRDMAVKTKIVTHARSLLARTRVNTRRDKAHTMRHALPPSLASAPTTSEEVELALRPALPSLQLHLTMAEQNALRTLTSTTNPPPPAAIVELRRRLWALACTPAYLPRTLVHLEGTALWRSGAKHHTNSNKANSVRLPLPYLKRLPAKELLPWLLVAAIGAAVELAVAPLMQSTQTAHHYGMTSVQEGWQSAVRALLSDVHANVMRSLCSHQPSYAAAAEYTASFCITSGMSIAEVVVLEYLKGNRNVATTQVTPAVQSEMWQRAELVLVAAVDVFFRPTSTTTAVCSWSGITSTATINENMRVVSLTPTHVDWLLHKCLSSERNYRVSLYFETLAQVAPSAGPLLRAYAQGVQAHGVPLLSPEAAASLTTALSLHDLNHYCNNSSCESKRYREAVLQACGPWLFFVIPADKSPAHYFRAMAHSDYLVDCVTQTPQNDEPSTTVAASITLNAKWPRSVAALLACRTLRRLERYPTSTAEPFFHLRPTLVKGGKGHAWNCTMQVPQQTLRLCAVDLVALFAHADTQHQAEKKEVTIQTSNSSNDDDCEGRTVRRPVQELPCVVARNLPYGLAAVYKPAHVNPTLHAHYDSLPFFLARHLPWRTTGPTQPNSVHSSVAQNETTTPTHQSSSNDIDVKCVPVWHQHGLLNRLDRGTSGLMLVADTSAALHAARHASLHGHVLRKSYRALVQYVAPRPAAAWAAQSLWYLPLRGVVHGAIHAEGSSAATLHSLRPNASHHTSETSEESDDDMEDSEVELPAASAPRLPTALLDRRVAHSEFHLLEVFPKAGVYYVEVRLWAGKRHQIRQHFARIGHPLLGDVLYHPQCAELVRRCRAHSTGVTLEAECEAALAAQCFGLTRPALHAHEIRIVQPARHDTGMTGDDEEKYGEAKVTAVRCALPQDMREALERLRSQR